MSWQRFTTLATRRSLTPTSCSFPDFPRNRNRSVDPETSTCRRRRVVRPYDLFARAYSSFPTRINVVSSSRTTVAKTFVPRKPGPGRGRPPHGAVSRKGLSEGDGSRKLRLVASLSPARVIAVLLPAARVTPARLQVPRSDGADPDVAPGRRDGERSDPSSVPCSRTRAPSHRDMKTPSPLAVEGVRDRCRGHSGARRTLRLRAGRPAQAAACFASCGALANSGRGEIRRKLVPLGCKNCEGEAAIHPITTSNPVAHALLNRLCSTTR